MKYVYGVFANSDNVEGRGRNELKYLCATEALAEELSKGLGPMGVSDGDISRMVVLETAVERPRAVKQTRANELLYRMSDSDIAALRDHFIAEDAT